MGQMERRLLLILSTLSSHFLIGYGQDVSFEYTDHCYNVGDTVTMKAVYKGSGSVLGVQWYYSGKTGADMFVDVSNCDVFGGVPPDGYPERQRMNFVCEDATKTYTLSLTELKKDELEDSWGATFSISGLSLPPIVQSTLSECESSTSTPTTSTIPEANTTGSTTSPPNVTDSDGKKIIIGVSVGVVIAVVLAILIGVFCYCKYKNKERKHEHTENNVSYSNNQGQDVQHGRFSNKSYVTENKL